MGGLRDQHAKLVALAADSQLALGTAQPAKVELDKAAAAAAKKASAAKKKLPAARKRLAGAQANLDKV